jgi:hypothetical protein
LKDEQAELEQKNQSRYGTNLKMSAASSEGQSKNKQKNLRSIKRAKETKEDRRTKNKESETNKVFMTLMSIYETVIN